MEDNQNAVQEIVAALIEQAKMSPQEIAEAMENRVSSRTIYRWWKGESTPQQTSDIEKLNEVAKEKLPRAAGGT
jgi:IS30 family transposase